MFLEENIDNIEAQHLSQFLRNPQNHLLIASLVTAAVDTLVVNAVDWERDWYKNLEKHVKPLRHLDKIGCKIPKKKA
jgi:hypothetical protein